MLRLNVKTQNKYDVYIGCDFDGLKIDLLGKKALIVTDTNVAPLYLQKVQGLFCGCFVSTKIIGAGESFKNFQTYTDILKSLCDLNFTKNDAIVALGGGVVGDICGFVASTYMRGICYYQMPTTLLSMVDSSVGGKTAIDFCGVKNLVGTFYQPTAVYINVSFLKTLDKLQLSSGIGEVVKYAFLMGNDISNLTLDNIDENLIYSLVNYKRQIVECDEHDNGLRHLLNLGHTIGHAYEAILNLPHGVCVLKGIDHVIDISQKFYGLSDLTVSKMKNLVNSLGILNQFNHHFLKASKTDLFDKIKVDKKAQGDKIDMVLLCDIGNAKIEKITLKSLGELL